MLFRSQALALSFLCFALSGIISSVNYRRKGQLDFRTALPLSAGSLIGAAAGAALNRLLPTDTVKLLLYLVVLFSGASILARQWLARRKSGKAAQPEKVPGAVAEFRQTTRWLYVVIASLLVQSTSFFPVST